MNEQCAFIRANCPDEEAGLLSYLQLYYCTLSRAKPVAFTILVVWISLLFSTIGIAASDFLCINLSTIAAVLGMSESLTGVTFLAFGNGSPDVFSTFAAMSTNSGSLAVGELMGAAGFITAVVAGSMALVKPFQVARKSFVRDVSFFAVAASFSLIFLKDGNLKLWECIVMVAFYVFYVIFVVAWHWWLQRQRRIRLAETAARLHHHIPDHQELEVPQIEIDEEARPAGERTSLLRSESGATVTTLLTPGTPAWKYQDNEEDDETRDRYLAELQSNMRVSRSRRDRRNTLTPIRPSLIGAIEFRSVLNALEKRSTTNPSIGLRRYSDDGQQDRGTDYTASQPQLAVTMATEPGYSTVNGRNRAVSANDAAGLQINPAFLSSSRGTPETAIFSPSDEQNSTTAHRRSISHTPRADYLTPGYSSNLLLSPSSMTTSSGASSPRPYMDQSGMLAPPSTATGNFHSPDYEEEHHDRTTSPMLSPNMDIPTLKLPQPGHRKSPLTDQFAPSVSTPSSSRAPSIRLPPPSMSPDSARAANSLDDEDFNTEMRKLSWWPYKYLPAPQTILSTLFPTLYDWQDKGIIGKVIGLATAPSVFLLTITLPVVEPQDKEEELDLSATTASAHGRRQSQTLANVMSDTGAAPPADSRPNGTSTPHPHNRTLSRNNTDGAKYARTEETTMLEQHDWNRWLVILQLFTAPIFVVMIVWANLDETHNMKELLLFLLGSLVFSLVGLFLLLASTTPDREPTYRPVLCFLGFAVAIAWISTIANEVVGVLKAIGVVLNMSDAILGLTIFAVGNSLGDLVADITVAKLGYPVMALSACFGGPMLNILLGIGLGGMYMTIHNGQHRHHKHPDKPIKYKPYELEVSTTLMISGITLLITLMGLLIVVPLNGWRMDRKIGIGLIALWTLSTIGNVVCEVLGFGMEGATTN